jgi:hypothetical protein
MSKDNYTITTSMVFGGNVLANLEQVLNQKPWLSTITYQDAYKFYMYKGTPCQVELPSKLTIHLANTPNYSTPTTTNAQKAKYVLTEIATWAPMVMTINGTKKHCITHADYVKSLHYFMDDKAEYKSSTTSITKY